MPRDQLSCPDMRAKLRLECVRTIKGDSDITPDSLEGILKGSDILFEYITKTPAPISPRPPPPSSSAS